MKKAHPRRFAGKYVDTQTHSVSSPCQATGSGTLGKPSLTTSINSVVKALVGLTIVVDHFVKWWILAGAPFMRM